MKKYILLMFVFCGFTIATYPEETKPEDINALKAEIEQLSKTLNKLNERLQIAEKQIEEQKQNSQKKSGLSEPEPRY